MKLLTGFEHHCCSRTNVRMVGDGGGGGGQKSPLPRVVETQKGPCQIGLMTLGLVKYGLFNLILYNVCFGFI